MRPELGEKYRKLEQDIRATFNTKICRLGAMRRNWEILEGFSDEELRIYQKNWYFANGKGGGSWPLTNFVGFPEFKADPAFQKLSLVYQKVRKADKFVDCGLESEHPLQPVYHRLCELATKMACRRLTESEYTAIQNETDEIFSRTADLPSPRVRTRVAS